MGQMTTRLLAHPKRKANRRFDLPDLLRAQYRNGLFEICFRDRDDGIEIDHARLGKAILGIEGDLGWDVTDSRRHGRHRHLVADGIDLAARQQDNRTPACWWWEVCPPHLTASQSQGSSAKVA